MLPSTYSSEKPKRSVPSGADGTRIRSLFFFHRDRNGSDGRKPDFVAFHLSNQAAINEVMMALVASLAAVLFSQLDAVAFNLINRANMDTIGPDYFHVLFDVSHLRISSMRRIQVQSSGSMISRRAFGYCPPS
jgi:hypothetical protein